MSRPFFLSKLLVRSGVASWLPAVRRLTDGGGSFLKYYSDRVLAAPHAELIEAAGLLGAAASDVLDLSCGTPTFDIVPSSTSKLPAHRRGFPPPWGLPELRTAFADTLRGQLGICVSPVDEVLITHGVTGAFATVLDAFVDPGRAVVLFDPSSPLYSLAARQRRARLRWVPTSSQDGRVHFSMADVAKSFRGARLVVINTPSNPTGAAISAEDLEQLAWWAQRRDALLFSDEVYDRYRYHDKVVPVASFPTASQRTITAGSVSKSHALASARVGWLAGHRHLVRACAVVAGGQSACVAALCQQIAAIALRQGDEAFEPILRDFDSRRRYAFERLGSAGWHTSLPAGGFFFWLPVGEFGLDGRRFAEQLLQRKKVVVTPGKLFGPSGGSCVRLSFAGDDGRFREGLRRLLEFVRELRAGATEQAARAA